MIDTNGALESLQLDAEMAAGMADTLHSAYESYHDGNEKFSMALWALVSLTEKVSREARAINNATHKRDIEDMRSRL